MTEQRITKTTATAVSAFLRRAGWTPRVDYGEGIRVSRGAVGTGGAFVATMWDLDRKNAEQSAEAERLLVEAGYVVERFDAAHFYVTGRKA